ncbi:hypothetical protein PATSB16_07350 [Pandoraea thiooxydans]|uniref:Uncharacterized protein n=1 Tax=Pandoraea thiooxydans TaxID=445709 RepID=A0A0G3EJL1_9BURK|nr:hypothetical protein [Pandoraea thiooxydans]AKJ67120.1 hypothetical protein ABW99_01635 [Pandoraea thiooxydans]APR94077.1 hypothetical protein PATSB16_07350 [Pandoraea thiooxydans]
MSGQDARAPVQASPGECAEALCTLLLQSLAALAAADQVDTACRIAGQAHAVLRRDDGRQAQRFNSLLHRLTPRLDW